MLENTDTDIYLCPIDFGPSWVERLRKARLFVVMGTGGYFGDLRCFAQCLVALDLKKPFFIQLQEGIQIPKEYKEIFDKADIRDVVYTKGRIATFEASEKIMKILLDLDEEGGK